MYSAVLARQAAELGVDVSVQVALLSCATHRARPLRVIELASALTSLLPPGAVPAARAKEVARRACLPLLEVSDDETVRIRDDSVADFLLGAAREMGDGAFPVLDPQTSHLRLAIACLRLNSSFGTGEGPSPEELPFFEYARQHWSHHLSPLAFPLPTELEGAIAEFCVSQADLETRTGHNTALRKLTGTWGAVVVPLWTPLHVAAYCGMAEYARALVEGDMDVHRACWGPHDSPSAHSAIAGEEDLGRSTSPLAIAVEQGHSSVVAVLWPQKAQDGAVVDLGSFGERALAKAISRDDADLVRMLLAREVSLPAGMFTSSLRGEDMAEVSRQILEQILALLTDESFLRAAFCACAAKGRDDLVGLMMDRAGALPTWKTDDQYVKKGPAIIQLCRAEIKQPGSVPCVDRMLRALPDVNARFDALEFNRAPETGVTVLHALCAGWSDENHDISSRMFDLLVAAGADLEAEDARGDTPIFHLFPARYPRSVLKPLGYLLGAGANVNAPGKKGGGILHRHLERHRDVRLLDAMISHGVDLRMKEDCSSTLKSPVFATLWREDFSLFDFEEGYDIIGSSSRAEITEYLARHGATLSLGENADDQKTLLVQILERCDVESLKIMLRTIPPDEKSTLVPKLLFSLSATSDLPGTIRAMMEAGADLEGRNEAGLTPLLAEVASPEVFDALLEFGADIHARNRQGQGVLHLLVQPSYKGCPLERIDALIEKGLDPLGEDKYGNSLIHLATTNSPFGQGTSSQEASLALLRRLIELGLSPVARNVFGETPLHRLFRRQYPPRPEWLRAVIDLLRREGSSAFDIDARDNLGLTPLHHALEEEPNSALKLMTILGGEGAEVLATANDGRSTLHIACAQRNAAVVQHLVADHEAGGALVSHRDGRGRTALFDACASGVLEAVLALLRAGADVHAVDDAGWTPLHACTERSANHALSGESLRQPVNPRRAPQARCSQTPEAHAGCQGPHLPDTWRAIPADPVSYFLESPEMCTFAVVEALLEHGADATAVGGPDRLTPGQRALMCGSHGMICALEKHGALYDRDLDGQPDKPHVPVASAAAAIQGAVLARPWDRIAAYDLDDVEWLKINGANLFCSLMVQQTTPAARGANEHCVTLSLGMSFVECVVLTGLTAIMSALGPVVRHGEKLTDKLDSWTLKAVREGAKASSIPADPFNKKAANVCWDPDAVKTYGDLLELTNWRTEPLLQVACRREAPNLNMIRVLVEKCGLDPDPESFLRVTGRSSVHGSAESRSARTTLALLATRQHPWHLDAIRYLVGRGADVNAPDFDGCTSLHRACASPDPDITHHWSHAGCELVVPPLRFVELLLDLGADVSATNHLGHTPLDLIQSPDMLRAIAKRGIADMDARASRELFLAVGRVDAEGVGLALDLGADVNGVEQEPVYRVQELDWEEHRSPLFGGEPAVPLLGALLYRDYLQPDHPVVRAKAKAWGTGKGVDEGEARGKVIRLLLDRGADPFVRLPDGSGPLAHRVMSSVRTEPQNLEVLLEHLSKGAGESTGSRPLDLIRDDQGRTLLLAACGASMAWDAQSVLGFPHDGIAQHGEDGYKAGLDPTAIFLRLLDLGADASPCIVDLKGRNALHTLLSNPDMHEAHILQFLSRRATALPLLHLRDIEGFTPIQHAFRILRPRVIDALVGLGTEIPRLPDPHGLAPLHHIAGQCMLSRVLPPVPARGFRPKNRTANSGNRLRQPASYLADCRTLWRRCVVEMGMDVDAPDARRGRADPPLFHYLAHHNQNEERWQPKEPERQADVDRNLHVEAFGDFFGGADLAVRNGRGQTALHVVATAVDYADLGHLHMSDDGGDHSDGEDDPGPPRLAPRPRGGGGDVRGGREDPESAQSPPLWMLAPASATSRPAEHDARLFAFLAHEKGLDLLAEDGCGRSSLDVAAEYGWRSKAVTDMFKSKG